MTLGPPGWIEEDPDLIQDSPPSQEYLHSHCLLELHWHWIERGLQWLHLPLLGPFLGSLYLGLAACIEDISFIIFAEVAIVIICFANARDKKAVCTIAFFLVF